MDNYAVQLRAELWNMIGKMLMRRELLAKVPDGISRGKDASLGKIMQNC